MLLELLPSKLVFPPHIVQGSPLERRTDVGWRKVESDDVFCRWKKTKDERTPSHWKKSVYTAQKNKGITTRERKSEIGTCTFVLGSEWGILFAVANDQRILNPFSCQIQISITLCCRLSLCAVLLVGTNFCAWCGSSWSRLAFGHPEFFFLMPPKHAAEPCGCPCQPRVPQRVRVRVSVRVGLVWADVQGFNWPHTSCTKFCADQSWTWTEAAAFRTDIPGMSGRCVVSALPAREGIYFSSVLALFSSFFFITLTFDWTVT